MMIVRIFKRSPLLFTGLVGLMAITTASCTAIPTARENGGQSTVTTVMVADWEGAQLLHTLPGHSNSRLIDVRSMTISADGSSLISVGMSGSEPNEEGSYDGEVRIWNLELGELTSTIPGLFDEMSVVTVGADHQTLVVGDRSYNIQLWNLETGEKLQTLPNIGYLTELLILSQDGKTLITANPDDQTVQVWDVESQQVKRSFNSAHEAIVIEGSDRSVEVPGRLSRIALSDDGKTLATTGLDKIIKLWNLETGELILTFPTDHEYPIHALTFSPDGETLVSGSSDNTVKLWNQEGELLHTLTGHSATVLSLQYSPNGEVLATSDLDSTVKLWNPITGELIQTLAEEPVREGGTSTSLTFSPNGEILAGVNYDGTIKVWQVSH
ncbi:WD40 repeat domain-containing protein [Oculatella sp. FACHB-28]|uniref:WD40 repeat domain-containing protein n=1 Tax=Oculatella sp. FACHB-28 TaxID=2692845 RepID=UPI0016857A10|nr:WD40 repeat domain-containing protein [Oculatella sp. FACHB-28]MBD2056644.1 WD40 repeat domain-containing protein [Oculatella sp. FACHB-28]